MPSSCRQDGRRGGFLPLAPDPDGCSSVRPAPRRWLTSRCSGDDFRRAGPPRGGGEGSRDRARAARGALRPQTTVPTRFDCAHTLFTMGDWDGARNLVESAIPHVRNSRSRAPGITPHLRSTAARAPCAPCVTPKRCLPPPPASRRSGGTNTSRRRAPARRRPRPRAPAARRALQRGGRSPRSRHAPRPRRS